MDRNEKCFCGSGKKHKHCHAGIERDSQFADLIRLYNKCDTMLALSKKPSGCCAGCDECCHQFFTVSAPEFLYVLFRVSQRSIRAAERLLEKGMKQWKEIKRLYPGVANSIEKGKSGDELNDVIDRMTKLFTQSQNLMFPCVFLNEETHQCDVYDYRPLICRYHGMGFLEADNLSQLTFCSKTSNGVTKNKLIDLQEVQPEILRLNLNRSEKYNLDIFEEPYPISFFCFIFTSGQDDLYMKMQECARFSSDRIADRKYERFLRREQKNS